MKKQLVTLFSLGLISIASAQDVSDIRNTVEVYSNPSLGGTARSQGMAGSLGALGGDLSSFAINPAGAGVYLTSEVVATGSILQNKNASSFGNARMDYVTKDSNLQQAGGVIVFTPQDRNWRSINLGLNYSVANIENYIQTPGNAALGESVEYDGPNNTIIQDRLVFNGHAYDRIGKASTTNFTVGGNYQDRIYVGAGVNFHHANFEQGDFYQYRLQKAGQTANYQKQYTPYAELGTGISISAGVIGRVAEGLRIGASIESPKWFDIERSYTEYGFNDNDQVVSRVSNEAHRLVTPFKTTLSIGYVVGKQFAVNLDWGMNLSQPTFKSEVNGGGEAEAQLNNFFQSSAKSLSDVRLGAEYRLGDFRLRGGYAYQSNPFDATSLSVLDSTSGNAVTTSAKDMYLSNRSTMTGGLGYNFKNFFVDAAVGYTTSKFVNPFFGGEYAVTRENSFTVIDGDAVKNLNSLVSDVTQNTLTISLGAGYRF